MVARQGAVLGAVGLLAGLGAALPASRLLRQLLYGVGPFDPCAYLAATGALTVVGGIACVVPAWRASRFKLAEVLRQE